MRTALLLFAFAFSTAAGAHSISDEFATGFGDVAWGMSLSDLVKRFPGGYQVFSTDPGHVAYILNIEDPVLGIDRAGEYVVFGTDVDGTVNGIEIQIPFESVDSLIRTISDRFGPVIGPKTEGLKTSYRWPTDGGLALAVRTSNAARVGLATLSIQKLARKSVVPSKSGDSRNRRSSGDAAR